MLDSNLFSSSTPSLLFTPLSLVHVCEHMARNPSFAALKSAHSLYLSVDRGIRPKIPTQLQDCKYRYSEQSKHHRAHPSRLTHLLLPRGILSVWLSIICRSDRTCTGRVKADLLCPNQLQISMNRQETARRRATRSSQGRTAKDNVRMYSTSTELCSPIFALALPLCALLSNSSIPWLLPLSP